MAKWRIAYEFDRYSNNYVSFVEGDYTLEEIDVMAREKHPDAIFHVRRVE